jgi:hypothetical protein
LLHEIKLRGYTGSFLARFATFDAYEGMKAFLAKREPTFEHN